MRLAIAIAAAVGLLHGCGGSAPTRPPVRERTVLLWPAVTHDTDEQPLTDITGYTVEYTPAGGTPTWVAVSADTTMLSIPIQSGTWTFRVWANSVSRGPGEAVEATRVIR